MASSLYPWLACLALAAACGPSAGKGNGQPSWRNSQGSASSSERTPPQSEFLELHATATTALKYNDPPRSDAPESKLSDLVLAAVREASARNGLNAPLPDGRLYRALDELAAVTPVDTPVTYSLIEFAMQRNGIIEPSPHMVIIWGDIDAPEEITAQLSERLDSILASGSFGRIGIGTARRGKDGDLILLAFQETHVTTNAIPRELPKGGSTAIEGEVARQFSDIRIFQTDDRGKVKAIDAMSSGGHGFRFRFECKNSRGRQQVEITAEDDSGSTVLANFPLWCDAGAPTSMRVAAIGSDPPPKTREEAEERMFVLLNEDRAKQDLPPLFLDARLTPVARKHSDDMLATGHVAHLSPTTGSAADRAKASNVRTAIVLENVARAYGVAEAQSGLMNSPGHRANILSTEVNRVGIGISLGDDVAGRRELLVTQVYIHVPERINPTKVRKEAIALIRKIKPMHSSPDLQQVAQSFAESIARGDSTETASAKAGEILDLNRGGFARVSTLITTVSDIASFNPKGSLGGSEVRYMGVGVAQGDHPVMGDGAIYLVVLLGEK